MRSPEVTPTARHTKPALADIVVDRIACDGYGMCAELLPEVIDLDDWGYPIIAGDGVPDELLEHARRAVAICPVLALKLEPRRAASVQRGQAGWHGPATGSVRP
jgi:ferredoxin